MNTSKLTDVRFLVVHCSATPPDIDADAAMIDRWHRQKGFFKIGYHFVVKRDGTVQTGRRLDEIGAHVSGLNYCSVGICLVGGVRRDKDADGKDDADGARWDLKPENNFTPQQFASLKSLLIELRAKFPAAEILGHRDCPNVNKACPSFDVRHWLAVEQIN